METWRGQNQHNKAYCMAKKMSVCLSILFKCFMFWRIWSVMTPRLLLQLNRLSTEIKASSFPCSAVTHVTTSPATDLKPLKGKKVGWRKLGEVQMKGKKGIIQSSSATADPFTGSRGLEAIPAIPGQLTALALFSLGSVFLFNFNIVARLCLWFG